MSAEKSILARGVTQTTLDEPHPAVTWVRNTLLEPVQIDCITAVMLKILDNKCKMGSEEQLALMAMYGEIKDRKGQLFDASIHADIAEALQTRDRKSAERIHELHLYAEDVIPKTVMKYFKQYLRESLFGVRWSV